MYCDSHASAPVLVEAGVEKWAADEFRSINGQLQWIVNEALRKARRLPKHKNGGNGELSTTTNDEENDNN